MRYGRGTKGPRYASLLVVGSLSLLLIGCFKKSNSSVFEGPSVSISVSGLLLPSTPGQVPSAFPISLYPGQSLSINAVVHDLNGQGVTWSATPVSFGTLTRPTSSSVVYTAPTNLSTPTTVTVTATSVSNPNVTASGKIAISPVVALYVPNVNTGLALYSPQNINQGEQITIDATPASGSFSSSFAVEWSLSPSSGAGSLSTPTKTSVTYAAPSTVESPTTVTITAQIAGTSSSGSLQVTVFPDGAAPNMVPVNVNGGPVPSQVYPNAAFTTVTLCNPKSATCQTIGGILVDTGSSGLRILQSQIPLLSLHSFIDSYGNTLENCDFQVDGSYLWGPVASFDVYIGGEAASSVPIQVITSSNTIVPDSCSNGGTTNENTAQLLGANGILGVGLEPTDCTIGGTNYCDGIAQPIPPNLYYTCPSVGCSTGDSAVTVSSSQQITNPVPLFSTVGSDTNGVVLQLPAVSGSESSLSGVMIFGIGSESNNALGSATVYTLDSSDYFTTAYNSQTLTNSFIDSGSNALYFPGSLPVCNVNTQYFCPPSLMNLSATNTGATQGSGTVSFDIDNADTLFSAYPSDAVFGTLAGPEGTVDTCVSGKGSCTFDWGLPFFYGRSVYTAIDGQKVPGGPEGPWWAY